MNRISIGIIVFVLILLWSVYRTASPGVGSYVRIVQEEEVMGTLCTITAYGEDEQKTRMALEKAFKKIKDLDHLMSHYDPNSLVSKINQVGAMTSVSAPSELLEILSVSRQISEETHGAFDITVGALMKGWGFFRKQGRIPSEKERLKLMSLTGYQGIEIDMDMEKNRIRLNRENMEIDLGAIGKGYALDQAAKSLREAGIEAALLDFQSVQLAIGYPPDKTSWLVGLRHPFKKKKAFGTIRLRDKALSVSGDAERFFEFSGKRYSHILDPRTGRPVEGVAMTAVVAHSATEADAYSTAAFVLGLEEGVHYLKEKKVDGLVVASDSGNVNSPQLETTAGWTELFNKNFSTRRKSNGTKRSSVF